MNNKQKIGNSEQYLEETGNSKQLQEKPTAHCLLFTDNRKHCTPRREFFSDSLKENGNCDLIWFQAHITKSK